MEQDTEIQIDNAVLRKAPTLFVKTCTIQGVSLVDESKDIQECKEKIITKWRYVRDEDLDSNPLIRIYRKLQKQLSEDSKMIHAVEGMLKRSLMKGKFPKVNSIVDIANIYSLKYLIPIGLFDLDKIAGEMNLVLSVQGDQFLPIGKNEPVLLTPGTPVLKDTEGIFSTVGSRDSKRTMVLNSTKNILIFSWGIEGVDPDFVYWVLKSYAEKIRMVS
jgi:DNA/RNA-binding domain of Phe-tRNA-synthetase-like protein